MNCGVFFPIKKKHEHKLFSNQKSLQSSYLMYLDSELDDELAIEAEMATRFYEHDIPPFVFYPGPDFLEVRNDFDQWSYLHEHETFCSASCDDFLKRRFDGRLSREQLGNVVNAIGVEVEPLVGAFYYLDKFNKLFPKRLRDLVAVHTESTVVAMFTVISSKFIDDEVLANDVISRRMGFSSVGEFNRLEKKVFSLMNGDAYIPPDQHVAYRKHLGLGPSLQ